MLSMSQVRVLYRKIGTNIQALRRHQLTQEELADMVGLSRTSIANLEAGRQRVPLHHLYGIAEALEVPVDSFLPDRASLGLHLEGSSESGSIEVVSDSGQVTPEARKVIGRVLQAHTGGSE